MSAEQELVAIPPQLIAATFRPRRRTITVFVEDRGAATAIGELTLDEARRLRDALDGALRIAANVDQPLEMAR